MQFRSLLHKRGRSPAPVRNLNPAIDGLFEQQHQHLIEAFRIIDQNRDGRISKKELKAMWATFGEKVTDKELRRMVQVLDVNGDGEIDVHEFTNLNRKVRLGIEDSENCAEELQLAFSLADVNRDGYISAYELQKVMKVLGIKKFTIAESYAMLRSVDSNNDDLISFQEFERLMTSSIFAGYKH